MTTIELPDATAAALRAGAERLGLSVDAYVRRLQLEESVRAHVTAMAIHPDRAESAAREAEAAAAELV